jgi:hypothetical protein
MTPKQVIIDGNKKKCSYCKEIKLLTEFVEDPRTTSGKTARCKKCIYTANNTRYHSSATFRERSKLQRKKSALKIRYGLSLDDVSKMLKDQDNNCAICQQDITQDINIDHNHSNGKVRQILCTPCNLGLGGFKDNPEVLMMAANYLRKHQ